MVRTSLMPSGSRLILVRIRSGMANASSRGRMATRISRSAATSSFTRRSMSATRSPCIVSNSKSIRPESGSMLPPVTEAW